jgi:hypothetical protein
VDRDRALPLIVALLAIVALGAAAATLDSTVVPGGGSGFGGDDAGVGGDSGGNATESPAPADRDATGPAEGSSVACLPVLAEPPALFAGLLLFVGLFVAVYRSTRSGAAAVAACGAVGLPVGLLWSALAVCGSPPRSASPSASSSRSASATRRTRTRPRAAPTGGRRRHRRPIRRAATSSTGRSPRTARRTIAARRRAPAVL